jgi:hypothetical protein
VIALPAVPVDVAIGMTPAGCVVRRSDGDVGAAVVDKDSGAVRADRQHGCVTSHIDRLSSGARRKIDGDDGALHRTRRGGEHVGGRTIWRDRDLPGHRATVVPSRPSGSDAYGRRFRVWVTTPHLATVGSHSKPHPICTDDD